MGSAPITIARGASASPIVQLTTDGVTPSTQYLSSDVLSARVWIGEDQPVLFTPGAAWLDATMAKFQLSFATSQTATLLPGTYYVQVIATRGLSAAPIFNSAFEITASPGTGSALKSYCSFRDMVRFAPWVARLQGQTDLAGFAQERQDARDWFDDLLQRHFRGGQGLSPDFYFLPGIAFGGWGGDVAVYRTGVRSSALKGWLDADGLGLTSEVIKANAAYAIAQVAKGQIVPGNDKSGAYGPFYAHFETLAETTASLITAEIDTNADGVTDEFIRLGIADTLEG